MPAGPSNIGITQATGTLLESVEWETKLEEKVIKDLSGGFGDGHAFDPIIEFSVKGRGDTAMAVGVGVAGIAAITRPLAFERRTHPLPWRSGSAQTGIWHGVPSGKVQSAHHLSSRAKPRPISIVSTPKISRTSSSTIASCCIGS